MEIVSLSFPGMPQNHYNDEGQMPCSSEI